MKYIITALILTTCISYSLDTLWTHNRGINGEPIHQAEFSPDESIIVLKSRTGIKAVSVETGETIWSKKVELAYRVTKISDLNSIILGAYFDDWENRNNFLIDVETGLILDTLFQKGKSEISYSFSKNGTLFSSEKYIQNNPNSEFDDEHITNVYNLDGDRIFQINTWSVSNKSIITPDNKSILMYGGVNGVKKYNIETGELEHHFNPIDTIFDYVEISEDGRYMVASNKRTSVYIYNLETNEVIAEFNDKGELFNIYFKDDLCLTTHVLSQESSESYFRNILTNEKLALLTRFPEDAGIPFSKCDNYLFSMGYEKFFLSTLNWTISSVSQQGHNSDLQVNPNPASEFLFINYLIEEPSNIILSINDIAGNQLQIIDDGFKTPNNYEINYNLNNIPSGTYFITLQINDNVLTKQIIKE